MNKETKKKLLAPFPAGVVQDPPKGKFGKYVNHAVYVERLRDCDVKYDWKFEPIIINDKVIGGKGTITIEGMGSYDGAGDVESAALNRATLGECLKLAESDAFKRACMRFGLGVELWSGTDDFYADDNKQKPIEKTGSVKDQVIEKEDELAKAKQDFAKDVADNPNNKQELAKFMDATIKDKAKRDKLKRKVYDDVVSKGFPKDINEWDESQIEIYKDEVFNANEDKLPDTTEAEEILGAKVTYTGPPTDENKVCPSCTDKGSVVDNRDKKSDPKFSKIPDFACQKAPYGSGCGWAAWSGNESIPSEWI